MTSIGDRLRRQRLQNRISLESIALETKIGVRMLEAIEAEQWDKLPGGVFRRSFVLQYAKALGIDSDEIASELKHLNQFDETPAIPTPDMVRNMERRPKSGFGPADFFGEFEGSTIGSLLAVVGVMLACALVYSWLQRPRVQQDEVGVQREPARPKQAVREQASREAQPPAAATA